MGAATARMMLSSLSVEELTNAIAGGDAKTVQRVKGVGAKTAQRIVLELQDKVGDTAMGAGLPQASAAMAGAASVKKEEAVSALVMLGFPKHRVLKYIDETQRYVFPLLDFIKEHYLEYNDAVFVIKYQITSILQSAKAAILW